MSRLLHKFLYESRAAPIIAAAVLLTALATLYYSSGALTARTVPAGFSSPLELMGQALLLTLIPVYMLVALVYSQRMSRRLAGEIDKQSSNTSHLRADITTISGVAAATGMTVGLLYASLVNIPVEHWRNLADADSTRLSIIFGQNFVWLCVGLVLSVRLRTARSFYLAGSVVTLDIFELSSLKSFARNGLIDALLVMGALALAPLQSIDAQFRAYNYIWALVVAIPAVVVLAVLPMYSIHARIVTSRNVQLEELGHAIKASAKDLAPESLSQLELLLQRKERLWTEGTGGLC